MPNGGQAVHACVAGRLQLLLLHELFDVVVGLGHLLGCLAFLEVALARLRSLVPGAWKSTLYHGSFASRSMRGPSSTSASCCTRNSRLGPGCLPQKCTNALLPSTRPFLR
ncbi:hypothetical protein HaLaN_16529 [Haematococcus lacustris]|uniref:Uncharacterized protein n=1 Tax=Haematococcus lacustris TaxID=44745 RepID=A0A699ZKQ7_HAELA|nr:hypothetical protein HaLaN_16529 [Haematococcus lacustris]